MAWRAWLCLSVLVPAAGWTAQQTTGEPVDGCPTLEQARKLIKDKSYLQAEVMGRELLAAAEAEHGTESLQAADALDVLVEALSRGHKAREPETRELAERAVAIRERTLAPEPLGLAGSLFNLVEVLHATGKDYAEAIPFCERALAIRESVLGMEHLDVAPVVQRLACLHFHIGDYPTSARLSRRALAIREKALGPDHLDVALSLGILGTALDGMGDRWAAKAHFERTLAIYEKVLGPDHPSVAVALRCLGKTLVELGDYAAATRCFERSLMIRKEAFGPNHPLVASSLNDLAGVLMESGEYARARTMMERVLTIEEKANGTKGPSEGRLANLAKCMVAMGDYAAAKPLLERALAIHKETFGPAHPFVAESYYDLGLLLSDMGDYAGAKQCHERALAIQEKADGSDDLSVAEILLALGKVLVKTGEDEAARPIYTRAVARLEQVPGPDHPHLAGALVDLASILTGTGETVEARALLQRALEISEARLGPDHPQVADALNALARLRWEAGDATWAFEAMLRAETIRREHQRLLTRLLTERQALGYASAKAGGPDLVLSAAVRGAGRIASAPDKAWDALIRSRALVLDEMGRRHRAIAEADDPEVARLDKAFRLARQRLANVLVRGPAPGRAMDYRSILNDAREKKEEAGKALAARSISFREEQLEQRVGLAEVRAALPPGSALVAFARYDQVQLAAPSSKPDGRQAGRSGSPGTDGGDPVPSYAAFVLGADLAQSRLVQLGAATEIEPLALRWGREAADGLAILGRSPEQAEADYRAAGEALRRKVWDPVAPLVEEAGLVFVVPAGALHLVSFAALPASDGGYLIEKRMQFHYLSAERDLLPSSKPRRFGEGLLALGAPAFDKTPRLAASPPVRSPQRDIPIMVALQRPYRGTRSECGNFRSLRFTPLPQSGREVEEVASLWRQSVGGAAVEKRLTGVEASEAAFKANAAHMRLLHLATHGFFLDGRCPSTLEGVPQVVGLGEDSAAAARENPLLLTGLALAGANQRDAMASDREDGILTAEEIASLDLSGVEWAVLSSCETGVGKLEAGEGVFGLRRAFQLAGVNTLITSLWAVEDEATREWMRALYEEHFQKGVRTTAAVRNAGLKMLRDRRRNGECTHPFYWGSFVSSGDWR